MRIYAFAAILALTLSSAAFAGELDDSVGVIRVFGDASSWMSACFVVGDGSWVVTTAGAVTEKVGPDTEQTIRYPVFISPYTGEAYQCELKCSNKDLGIALLKLPIKGLPAAPLGQLADFKNAARGTLGQLMSGEPIGNDWPTHIYGITREKIADGYKLDVGGWSAKKMFITDIGKYKWAFISEVGPDKPVPDGAVLTRGSTAIGMYLSKLTITGGKQDVVFGRCAMSTEIARYASDRAGIDSASLYDPPKATIAREDNSDAAFQLQAAIYSLLGAQVPRLAVNAATELVKLRPKSAQARMVSGMALAGDGKFEEALAAYDEAFKLDPALPTLRTSRALALIGLEKTKEAESELLKAVEEAPMDPRPVTALAGFYLADDKTLDKALTYANKAALMASRSPAAKLLVAQVQKRAKDYKAATASIGEALKMAPEWGEAWYALGAVCEEAGDNESAEKAYRTLVEKEPKSADSLLTLASFLADRNQTDEALELIARVRELKPPQDVLDAAKALEDAIQAKHPTDTKPKDT